MINKHQIISFGRNIFCLVIEIRYFKSFNNIVFISNANERKSGNLFPVCLCRLHVTSQEAQVSESASLQPDPSIIFPSGEIGPGSYGLSSEIRKHSSAVDDAVSLEASLDFFPPENT